jgi:exonuclease III
MNKIIFIFLVSSQILSAQTINDLYFGTDTTFDVISWNIEWFPKNNSTASEVQEILTRLEADIYALQEIEDTTLLKQVVSNIPGYECYFKSSYYGGLAYVYNTNTIQINSKYEIFTSQPYWNAFPRSPQVLDCNFMGNNYIIINNHFKCCGDGTLNTNDTNDEENRRLQAVTYLKQYIDNTLLGKRVILLGDLNDEIIDNTANNVFQDFINDNTNYLFTDMFIAEGNSIDWSYPTWPSHLDHILITNELFADFQNFNSFVSVIRIDDYMGSWSNYENNISDHRPIGLKLDFGTLTNISEEIGGDNRVFKALDVLGRENKENQSGLLVYIYEDGTVEKKIILE